jgi:hypothetical protein
VTEGAAIARLRSPPLACARCSPRVLLDIAKTPLHDFGEAGGQNLDAHLPRV